MCELSSLDARYYSHTQRQPAVCVPESSLASTLGFQIFQSALAAEIQDALHPSWIHPHEAECQS